MAHDARRRWTIGLVTVVLLGGCQSYVLPLPFGYTVNFPGFTGKPLASSELEHRIRLPEGFSITTYASGIENARMIRFTSAGDLLVSAPRQGKVFLVERDPAHPAAAAGTRVLLDGLHLPHGLALDERWLYVGEGDAVLRVAFDSGRREVSGSPERIVQGLPSGGNHWTKTIGIGPDGLLYLTMGSDCNVCIEKDPRRAAMLRFHRDGSAPEIYATGLRNAVGFDWQPGTGELYATDNGRDYLGDDFPPCEFDHIVQGGFYGWPFANGDRVPDPDFGAGHAEEIARSIPPAHGFMAHVAPLGMRFYTGKSFPPRYHGAAFVAQHGSWNRSKKSGYKVVALFLSGGGQIREEDFVSGFMIDEQVSGRPVDVDVGPDGALYVSDDFTGQIYRVAYGPPESAARGAGASVNGPPARTPGATPQGDPLAALAPAEVERAVRSGQTLWDANGCARCHLPGARAEVYRPLGGLAGKYTIDRLADFFLAPQPPMPVFPFSAAERHDLAIYLLRAHP